MTERGADPWHGWGAGGRPLDERVAAVVVPAPVVFQGATTVDDLFRAAVPRAAFAMARAAMDAGWHVVVTEALAGVVEVTQVNLGDLPQEDGKLRAGQRKTEDVLTPAVLRTVALRMAHPDGRRAYGVWSGDGKYRGGQMRHADGHPAIHELPVSKSNPEGRRTSMLPVTVLKKRLSAT